MTIQSYPLQTSKRKWRNGEKEDSFSKDFMEVFPQSCIFSVVFVTESTEHEGL